MRAVDGGSNGDMLLSTLNRLADSDERQIAATTQLSQAVDRLVTRMDETYVHRREYESDQRGRDQEVKHLAESIAKLAESITWAHRSTWTSVIFPLLMITAGVLAGFLMAAVK